MDDTTMETANNAENDNFRMKYNFVCSLIHKGSGFRNDLTG